MERRITRSEARAAAALLAESQSISSPAPQPLNTNANATKRKRMISSKASVAAQPAPKAQKVSAAPKRQSKKTKKPAQPVATTRKVPSVSKRQSKRHKKPTLIAPITDEFPHNLGPAPASLSSGVPLAVSGSENGSDKENQTTKEEVNEIAIEIQQTVDDSTETIVKKDAEEETSKKSRKVKRNPYGLTPGATPFPEWVRPTIDECEEVNRLLSSVHGEITAPKTIPEPSLAVTGCGEVPSVLDALIRTLLSGATTGNNSAKAFNGLVQRFGILTEGIGQGSVNWDAVRRASLKDVFEAIKSGGLADIKSKNLKAILDLVHKENQERRDLLLATGSAGNEETNMSTDKAEKDKHYEIACADQNFLSLNHLHHLSSEEAMMELVKYPGIGPKTAACVILFCLQRPCFAVDTHIFRICKWLGWVPPTRANEVTAFSHLEVRIPDHLKYSLHQLFIRHGKTCPRCRAITGESSTGWEDGCVIDHLVTRTGKRKGAAFASTGPRKNGRKSRGKGKNKAESDDEESELSEMPNSSEE